MKKNYSVICCKEYDCEIDSFGNPIDAEVSHCKWSNDVWLGTDVDYTDIADIVLSYANSIEVSYLEVLKTIIALIHAKELRELKERE